VRKGVPNMQRLLTQIEHPVFSRTAKFAVVGFCVLALWILLGAHGAAAQTTAFQEFADASTLSQDSIGIIIARIIRIFLGLTGLILAVLVVYAGFLYMTAQGVPAQIEKAKAIIKNAVIGLVIIFSSYAITTWILNALLQAAFTGNTEAVADRYADSLSAALGAGILEDHYPERNAVEVPRNTNIFVTFKKPIEVSTIIDGYDTDASSTDLNTDSVKIFRTEFGESDPLLLTSTDVIVSVTDDHQIFVFNPTGYLGNPVDDTNYTVLLTANIETESGEPAFTSSVGYPWTFEVSTEIDLTPPYVRSVVPVAYDSIADDKEARNVTIEMNFSEPMNPIAVTGIFDPANDEFFSRITVTGDDSGQVNGTFEISNGYKTVGFTTMDACGEDPCGDLIYCLPGEEDIDTVIKAATLDISDIPQADISSGFADGAIDAANNSLDGDNNYDASIAGTACGSDSDSITCNDGIATNDNYDWMFKTSDDVDMTVPHIEASYPTISEDEISQTDPVANTFSGRLKSSTLSTSSVSLWPDPYYPMWFTVRKTDDYYAPFGDANIDASDTVLLEHPTFVSLEEDGWDYWPVMTNDIKGNNQVCMYPAIDEVSTCGDPLTTPRTASVPYCCAGVPSSIACKTDAQADASFVPPTLDDVALPGNQATEL
jgi:hypothetical protein